MSPGRSIMSLAVMRSIAHVLACAIAMLLLFAVASRAAADGRTAEPIRSADGSVEVLLGIDRESLRTVERLELAIEATMPITLTGPQIAGDDAFGAWKPIGSARTERRVIGGDRVRVKVRYTLEPFLPGTYSIPPLELRFVPLGQTDASEDGAVIVRTAELGGIRVESVLPESDEARHLADLKPIAEAPDEPRLRTALRILALAGKLVALVIAAVLLVRRARGRSSRITATADQVAFALLEKLREDVGMLGGRPAEALGRASQVLRHYIEDRFGLHAPERTTEEFLREAKGCVELAERDIDVLGRFLAHCDMVKFAGVNSGPEDAEHAVRTVEEFVRMTASAERRVVVPVRDASELPGAAVERLAPRAIERGLVAQLAVASAYASAARGDRA